MKPKLLTSPSELVLSAIYNLDESNGSSPQDITDYISGNYGIDSNEIKRKVDAALQRILSFGLISRDQNGLYKLKDINELPEEPTPQRAKRKRRKMARQRKRVALEPEADVRAEEARAKASGGRHKKPRMDAGEGASQVRAKNPRIKLATSYGSTNLNPSKKCHNS